MFRFLPAAALALVAMSAVASPADPTDPRAAVRPLVHRSTLAGRAAPDHPELADWRAVNERVRAVGGWKAYLKQAQAPDPAPAASPEATR
jgi:predicted outer membrane protein